MTETRKAYDYIAKKFDEAFCKTIYFKEQLDKFIKQLKPNSKIIDIGCGTGHVVKYLAEQGFTVLGIDFSKKMLKIAKQRCEKCEFLLTDIRDFDYGNQEYDAAIIAFSLIHVTDQEISLLLPKINKGIKQGGVIFVGAIEGEGDETIPEPLAPEHKTYFNYFTKSQIKELISKHGFKVLSIDEVFLKEAEQNEFFIIAKKE